MRPLIVIRRTPKIDFMKWHKLGFALSALLTLSSIVLFLTVGLNYGIDFVGGTQMEVRVTPGPANLAEMRQKLDALHIGDVSLQGFGPPTDVLIRLARQPGGDAAQERAVELARKALGPGIDYRRIEVVGPTVGSELIRAGVIATILALAAIAVYIAFRFEWQFGIGGMVSTLHDVITTVGLFALFHLEFNLTTLVAGALMFWLGSGPVKGFAVTLSIGVLTSLFSAILVTRLLIVTWVRRWKPREIPI